MFDVGKIDVVIFDCYVCDVMIKYLCNISSNFFMCTSKSFIVLIFVFCQICLILAEATAIGIRLSHASRTNLDSWRTAQ